VQKLAAEHDALITVEEGAEGGFGSHVLGLLSRTGALDAGLKIRTLTLPDRFIDHDAPFAMYAAAGLNAPQIAEVALALLDSNVTELPARA
jgi:1-deoxy-D-xylulose-5-phosphate synthase